MKYNSKFLAEIQAIAKIGGWKYDFSNDEVTWTNQIYYIHGIPTQVKPSLDSVLSLYTSPSKELFFKAFEKAKMQSIPFNIELKLKAQKNGREAWVRCIGRPFKKEGEVYKISGIVQDITEEKNSRELAKMGEWRINFKSSRTEGSTEICKQFGLNSYDFDLSIEEYYSKIH
uniref:PAS domain-containing protein n=1 Tax=Flexithrix dorotheae TaxID=70993 RepID=UPI0005C61674